MDETLNYELESRKEKNYLTKLYLDWYILLLFKVL